MLKAIVDAKQALPENIAVRNGQTNGRDWTMRSQDVWVYTKDAPFPQQFNITLPDNVQFYPAGDYELDVEAMICLGSYRSLSLGRGGVVLTPAKPAPAQDSLTKKFPTV